MSLSILAQDAKNISIKELSSKRDFYSCNIDGTGLFLETHRHFRSEEIDNSLFKLCDQADLLDKLRATRNGAISNPTENRQVLHSALRDSSGNSKYSADIASTFSDVNSYIARVHSGAVKGATGKTFTDVVNIGIGGSHLGPEMIYSALQPCCTKALNAHFVSNVDANDLLAVIEQLDPETTLFVVASKTFTTIETLTNALSARNWLESNLGTSVDLSTHFAAVTAAPDKAIEFGVASDQIFPLWDWVGGRYSLWSSIGIAIAIAYGYDVFVELLAGAEAADRHSLEADYGDNAAVQLAMLSFWYTQYLGAQTHCVLPYDHALRLLPDHLQQLQMESNGKSVKLDGSEVTGHSTPVVWGAAGTNGQHSFHQLLHQGTELIPADIIIVLSPAQGLADHHKLLVANGLAQSQAFVDGKQIHEITEELVAAGMRPDNAATLAPHKVIKGNRPHTIIALDEMSPKNLGALVALYENKVELEAILMGINAYDQWGVELGKVLATKMVPQLESGTSADTSYANLVSKYAELNK